MMQSKLEISIDLIVHATENPNKFFDGFKEIFGIEQNNFSVQNLMGHFDNPIIFLSAKILKKDAKKFIEKFVAKIPRGQIEQLIAEIEQRVQNSTLHVRLDKQEFVKGKLSIGIKNVIKLKIYTPIYNKKNTEKIYSELLNLSH